MDKTKQVTIIAMIFLIIPLVFSAPLPQGIRGYVYDLDNVTRANENVEITITNLNNSYSVSGNLRKDGGYSAVVNGEYNDSIEIFVYNMKYNASRIVLLDGVMDNINLMLNLSDEEYSESGIEIKIVANGRVKITKNKRGKIKNIVVVTGKITDEIDDDNPYRYIIKNLETNESVEGLISENEPGYSDVIPAKEGDLLEITVEDKEKSEKKVVPVTGGVVREDISLFSTGIKTVLDYLPYVVIMIIPIFILGMGFITIRNAKKRHN
jgi:hypothetical protein